MLGSEVSWAPAVWPDSSQIALDKTDEDLAFVESSILVCALRERGEEGN